jgi:hypothetical protein
MKQSPPPNSMLANMTTSLLYFMTIGMLLFEPNSIRAQKPDEWKVQASRVRCSISPEGFKDWLTRLQQGVKGSVLINDVVVRYRMIVVFDVDDPQTLKLKENAILEMDDSCKLIHLSVISGDGSMKIATGDLVVQFAPSAERQAILTLLKQASLTIISGPTSSTPERYWVRDEDENIQRLLNSATSLAKNRLVVFAEADTLRIANDSPKRPF